MKTEANIVTLDIETCPISAYVWGIWEQNVGLNMIAEEWTILSFSVKRLGEKGVTFHSSGGRGKAKVRDDYALCQRLWDVLDAADIVVTQNGQQFDIKKINARLIMHGFKPYSPVKVIDTKLAAKKHFGFTSNRLEWMSKHVNKGATKDKHKKFPGFELWQECMLDNPKAWAEMRKYNNIDVVATEELYLHMRPWMSGHPNLDVYRDADDVACPRCQAHTMQRRGVSVTQTGRFPRYQCTSCGGWTKGRTAITAKVHRSRLMSGV